MPGGWTRIQDVGPSHSCRRDSEPTYPYPVGTVWLRKRDTIRGWAQGKDGPGLPFPGAPQARLVELPLVVGVFRAGPLSPSSEWAELPADEATQKGGEGPHDTYLWKEGSFGPAKPRNRPNFSGVVVTGRCSNGNSP